MERINESEIDPTKENIIAMKHLQEKIINLESWLLPLP